ncbi:MAG: hypothetical protein EPO40_13135 [Myxococcaceae bacterium]|nr:MAG: hypothetical protein EPO40_13135 [Myxococcaceae bacterium]
MRGLNPLLLLGSLAACGARTELLVATSDASVVPDVAAVDVARPEDASRPIDAGAPVDAPPRPPCVWTATAPLAITAGDRDRSPLAVRVLDDRLWVGLQSSNPDPPGNQGRFVRVTDALGRPVAPAVEVLPSPGALTSYGAFSLWTNPVTREHAAMSWTEGLGCRVVRLDDNARPVGESVQVDRAQPPSEGFNCSSVVRHRDGWTYLTGSSIAGMRDSRLHVVTPSGVETAAVLLTPDDPIVRSTARLAADDGSFLYAWIATSTSGTDAQIVVRRFDVRGRPLSPATALSPVRVNRSIGNLRLAPDGDAALVAWSETAAVSVELVVARTSLDGAVRVAPTTIARAPGPRGRQPEFGLAASQGVPGVVWQFTDGEEGAGGLRLTTLDPATLRPGATTDVDTERFVRNVFLRGTSQGFVAVFGAISPPTLTQVWTASFRCVAPG